jgi:hypothetical protein
MKWLTISENITPITRIFFCFSSGTSDCVADTRAELVRRQGKALSELLRTCRRPSWPFGKFHLNVAAFRSLFNFFSHGLAVVGCFFLVGGLIPFAIVCGNRVILCRRVIAT